MKNIFNLICLSIAVMHGQSHNAKITVYKDGMALVDQPLSWTISEGFNTVTYSEFPSQIHKNTPFLTLQSGTVYSQRYDEDVFSFNRYYTEKKGSPISLKIHDDKVVDGTLLQFKGESIVVQMRSGVRTFLRSQLDYFEFGDQLEDLRFDPELVWTIYVTGENTAYGNLIYLTGGLDWNAVYRLIMEDKSTEAEFVSQALVENTGDLDFSGLQMKLVEGNLNNRPVYQARKMARSFAMEAGDGLVQAPEQESLGDFHVYTIDGKHRLKPGQTVLLKLYDPRQIQFKKTYVFENSERQKREEPLEIHLAFENTEENNLGVPLPQGKVELYYKDNGGSIVYAGSDNLRQVPRLERAKLHAGRAFDVVGKRKILNYDRQRKAEEGIIEIDITNARNDTISVHIIEHISGDWVIRNETSMYVKDDASTIRFPLTLNPEERKTISYTYRKEFK